MREEKTCLSIKDVVINIKILLSFVLLRDLGYIYIYALTSAFLDSLRVRCDVNHKLFNQSTLICF